MISTFYKKYNIYLLASAASVLLTCIILAHNQPFNPDGLNYLKAAQAFFPQGFHAAMAVYNWPFYSILIAIVSKFTYLSVLHAAYLLGAILDTVTVLVFIALIKELGGSKITQWIGAFVILFYPYFSHMRHHVLRHHGYYAFALLAILLLIKYFRAPKWRYALGWGIAIILATLFRVEGAALALLLPLGLLWKPKVKIWPRFYDFIKAYSIHIVIFIFLLFYFIFHHGVNAGRLTYIIGELIHGLQTAHVTLQAKIVLIKKDIFLIPTGSKYATAAFLFGGLLGLVLVVVVKTLGLLYAILSVYAMKQKAAPFDWAAKNVWVLAIIVNIILIALFVTQQFFVVTRYVALLCILLLLTVPFGIEKLYKKRIFPLVALGLIIVAISSVGRFAPSKAYIVDGGDWIANNTPAAVKIFSNDSQFFYYAKRQGQVAEGYINQNLTPYDYVIIKISRHSPQEESQLLATIKVKPVKIFHNKRGDKLFIFKLK